MLRSFAQKLIRRVRRFNRSWIDRLDPDWPRDEPAEPARAPAPAPIERPRATGPVSVWAEATPNPDAVKFSASVKLVDAPVTWREGDRTGDPLGQALLAVPGVRSAFAVGDFVTVTRTGGADWERLQPAVEEAIRSAVAL